MGHEKVYLLRPTLLKVFLFASVVGVVAPLVDFQEYGSSPESSVKMLKQEKIDVAATKTVLDLNRILDAENMILEPEGGDVEDLGERLDANRRTGAASVDKMEVSLGKYLDVEKGELPANPVEIKYLGKPLDADNGTIPKFLSQKTQASLPQLPSTDRRTTYVLPLQAGELGDVLDVGEGERSDAFLHAPKDLGVPLNGDEAMVSEESFSEEKNIGLYMDTEKALALRDDMDVVPRELGITLDVEKQTQVDDDQPEMSIGEYMEVTLP